MKKYVKSTFTTYMICTLPFFTCCLFCLTENDECSTQREVVKAESAGRAECHQKRKLAHAHTEMDIEDTTESHVPEDRTTFVFAFDSRDKINQCHGVT